MRRNWLNFPSDTFRKTIYISHTNSQPPTSATKPDYAHIPSSLLWYDMRVLYEEDNCHQMLDKSSEAFHKGVVGKGENPLFECVKTSIDLGMYDVYSGMIDAGHYYEKAVWKRIVWERAWALINGKMHRFDRLSSHYGKLFIDIINRHR